MLSRAPEFEPGTTPIESGVPLGSLGVGKIDITVLFMEAVFKS